MSYTKRDVLAHVDALIDRQQYELDEIAISTKKPRMRMDRAKDRISRLRQLRHDLATNGRPDPHMLDSIHQDMRSLGW